MSKISKFIKKPKLFFKDFFKKNKVKINSNVYSFFNPIFKGNYLIENFLLYLVIILTPFLFSYFYLIGRNKYQVSSSIVLRKSKFQKPSPDLNLFFTGLNNQSSLPESKYLEV